MSNKPRNLFIGIALIALFYLPACSKSNAGPDPATANMATPDQAQAVTQASYQPPAPSSGEVQVSEASAPPPPLPEYTQPECPGDNYLWTPGYWAYAPAGYYWVPGAWVVAPYAGALWTPAYWEFDSGRYHWHAGYWSRHVGFYGGINYGFGYTGLGFYGGYWNSGGFVYNRAVTNVNVKVVRNVYNNSVRNYTPNNRVSFNGGPGGISRRATPGELAVRRESHTAPMPFQSQQMREAATNRAQFANENHGRPENAAIRGAAQQPNRAPEAARPQQQPEARGRQNVEVPASQTQPRGADRRPADVRPNAAPQQQAQHVPQQRMPEHRTPQGQPAQPAQSEQHANRVRQQQPPPQHQVQHPGTPAAQPHQPQRPPQMEQRSAPGGAGQAAPARRQGGAPQQHPQAVPAQHDAPPANKPAPPQRKGGDDHGRGGGL